jgi:hypothetical protein
MSSNQISGPFLLVSAALVAAGIALGGWLAGQGLVESRLGDRTVIVKGLSERPVDADLALWPIRFAVTGDDLTQVQAAAEEDAGKVKSFLMGQGFSEDEIRVDAPQVTDRLAQAYRSGPVDVRYIINRMVMLRSTDVRKVAAASARAGELVQAGVVLTSDSGNSRPTYAFTRLTDVKEDMIREALAQARSAANTFAADSGATLRGIRRANQGQFQILPRDDAPGIFEAEQIEKTVRVVSTIEYLLSD